MDLRYWKTEPKSSVPGSLRQKEALEADGEELNESFRLLAVDAQTSAMKLVYSARMSGKVGTVVEERSRPLRNRSDEQQAYGCRRKRGDIIREIQKG